MSGACRKRPGGQCDDEDGQRLMAGAPMKLMRNSKREENSASSELPDRASPLTPAVSDDEVSGEKAESACTALRISEVHQHCDPRAAKAPGAEDVRLPLQAGRRAR